jgi:predicted ATPase
MWTSQVKGYAVRKESRSGFPAEQTRHAGWSESSLSLVRSQITQWINRQQARPTKVKIRSLRIRNYRCFDQLDLSLESQSILIIGENAGGKTSLLTAIARALGRDLTFTGADFLDQTQPIEIAVTLEGFDVPQRALFGDYIQFGVPPTLEVGVRAIWDSSAEEAEVEHWYPRHAASRSKRREREGLPVQWLSSTRDPARMLQFGATRNLMGLVASAYPIEAGIETAVENIRQASVQAGRDTSLARLLSDAGARFRGFLPEVAQETFSMGVSALTVRDLLRLLELQVQHPEEPVSVSRQSSGIAQLALFSFALQLADSHPATVFLVDEPELSLHPQAQRALMRSLRRLSVQTVIATHSSNLLEHVDPRMVVRLKRESSGSVRVCRPIGLADAEARHLARNTRPHVTEAFFARSVVLVEGPSDRFALEVLADRQGRNLDALGISIVPIGGAAAVTTYLDLFGPNGFDLKIAGLCDEAEEMVFWNALRRAGHTINSRNDLERHGFHVCVVDLEDELVRAVGVPNVVQIISNEGDSGGLSLLQQQPTYRTAALDEQVRAFVARNKVKYAPLLVEAMDLTRVPPALGGVLQSV